MSPTRRAALTTFLLGLIVGAAAGSWGQRAMFRRFMKKGGPDAGHMIRKLDRELALDENQKGAILTVLGTRKTEIEGVKKECQTRFDGLRASTNSDIRKTLRSEQQSKFDALVARWEQRRKEREKDGPPPGP